MKLIHLSDIHLGKRVNEFSMLEDQAHILKKILAVVDEEKPNGVLIAGDVYDKSVPSTEAVQLFDDFLVRLAERKLPVFIISGNHDSPERLSFANRLIDAVGIHLAPVYNGVVEPITLSDEYGPVNVYMLPFIKPAHVRGFFPDTEITGYSDAVAAAIGRMNIDKTQRNVLITHQFVTGAQRSDSEELSVGGTDNIGAEVFCGSAAKIRYRGKAQRKRRAGNSHRAADPPPRHGGAEGQLPAAYPAGILRKHHIPRGLHPHHPHR